MGGDEEPSGRGRSEGFGGRARLARVRLRAVLAHGAYFVPHGSLQFLLAVPTAVIPALLADGRVAGLSNASIALAFSVGTAANAVGKVVNGPLIDAYGARRSARVFLVAGVVGCAAFAATKRPTCMFGAFLVVQFAASAGWLVGCRVIHDSFAKRSWTACFAVLSAASRVGSICSKLGLGALLAACDWQTVALAAAGVGAALTLLVSLLLPLDNTERARHASRGQISADGDAPSASADARARVPSLDDVDEGLLVVDDAAADAAPGGAVTNVKAAEETVAARVRRLATDRGLLLYCVVMGGATCVSSFDNLAPMVLTDLTSLPPALVTVSATIFPAALFSCVLAAPRALSRLDARREGDPRGQRFQRLGLELGLLALSFLSALGLAALAKRDAKAHPALVLPCLFGLAFGVAVTFYITPNVFALDVGGALDCATASSILDTFGLVASSLWALAAGKIAADHGDDDFAAWRVTLVVLAAIILLTMAASVAAVLEVNARDKRRRAPQLLPDRDAPLPVGDLAVRFV